MRILSTPDLCCPNCGEKIHNALEKAITILDDLGYEAKRADA